MIQRFLDLAKCPDEFANALVSAAPSTQQATGQTYVPALSSFRKTASRIDPLNVVLADTAGRSVPFDKAVDILRFEHYAPSNAANSFSALKPNSTIRRLYYWLRPLLSVAVRKHFQRMALKNWQRIPFPRWPVDFSVENLMLSVFHEILIESDTKQVPFIWFWPKKYRAACIMTHDVETKAGLDFIPNIINMEKEFGIKSSFELVPQDRYTIHADHRTAIADAGNEVCIHGLNHDGRLFSSELEFKNRAEKINSYAREYGATGFRSPVMYRNLEWYRYLKLSYDMSVPNCAHLDPQRGGCCTVMPYFIGDILELPLTTIQDYPLYNILRSHSLDLWREQTNAILSRNGLVSYIIHPDYTRGRKEQDLFKALLAMLRETAHSSDLWLALPREVDAWWRDRHKMRLVAEPGGWKILGPRADSACLAFARMEGSEVVFDVTM